MAAVVHLISILLALLISDVTHAAALLNDHAKISSEAWPPMYWGPYPAARSWGQPVVPNWQPPGRWSAPDPKPLNPILLQNPNTVKNTEEKVPPENPETHVPEAKPRSFQIKFQAPVSNTEDSSTGQDYSQSQEPGHFHLESQLKSPSKVSSQTGSFYPSKDPQDSSKPGFHFSLSVPIPTTTAAPKAPGSAFNAGFSKTGTSQTRFNYPYNIPEVNKPVYQRPSDPKVISQRPPESKLVSFLSGLLNQKEQSNQNTQTSTRTQQNPVFFKPVAQNQPSSQSPSGSLSGHHQTPTNYWMGQMHLSSNDAGSGAQNPVHQGVQNVHYSRLWFPVTSSDSVDVRNSILQSAKYVNGQLMIPLEKCPGFEKFAALLQNHYPGQVHHHGQTPPSGPVQTKPHYTNFYLNMEGAAPNPTQGTNVQQSGTYQETPFRWWQDSDSVSGGSQNLKTDQSSVQFFNPLSYTSYVHKEPDSHHSIVKPGHTNYMVQLGANVGYDQQPDLQSQNNFEYVHYRRNPY